MRIGVNLIQTMKFSNAMTQLSVPLLAILNLIDAFSSFSFFRLFGFDIERNPLISAILKLDDSAVLFLSLKLTLSLILILYWKSRMRIHLDHSILGFIGVFIYLAMFAEGFLVVLNA